MAKLYSLSKCKKIYKEAVLRRNKLEKKLSDDLIGRFDHILDSLEQANRAKDIDACRLHAAQVEDFLQEHGKKTLFESIREFTIAILVALLIAAVVRQMWFELYEIPTGSMRPTFRENDRVLVFKDTFCINKPFETAHFYFEPQYVKRGSIVVITGDELDLPDVDTVYFGLFPGKRRYVKRSVAKDGDSIYFYGGKLYGLDKEGKPISSLLEDPLFSTLEYIPFISFEGKVDQKGNDFILRHMNIPVAKVGLGPTGRVKGEMMAPFSNFGKTFGIDNFAMCRLINPSDLPKGETPSSDAELYLELKHNPSLPNGLSNSTNLVNSEFSLIPLSQKACKKLKDSLYTARFYTRKGIAYRYTPEGPDLTGRGVLLDTSIPDGCYEFIDGKAYEIGFGAYTSLLDKTHPIYPTTLKMLKTLYNSGIDFSMSTNTAKRNGHFPARYAYFRDGDLYTMAKPLFSKDDKELEHFVAEEQAKKQKDASYIAFVDNGPPSEEEIKTFGLHIPEKHYLLLGDNHAMSNDSRFFGPVPQKNLQGSPALTFWPPGERWGSPPQPSLPFFRASRVIVVACGLFGIWIAMTIYNYRTRRKK